MFRTRTRPTPLHSLHHSTRSEVSERDVFLRTTLSAATTRWRLHQGRDLAGKGFGGMGTLLPFGRESSVRERKTHHLGGGGGLAGGEMTARGMRRALGVKSGTQVWHLTIILDSEHYLCMIHSQPCPVLLVLELFSSR